MHLLLHGSLFKILRARIAENSMHYIHSLEAPKSFTAHVQKRFPASQIRMTAAHVAIATAGLATVGKTPTTLFVFTVVCVTFVGPLWLLSVQKYKRTIRGPWDEAVVKAIE
jgi:hypothetical protein